MADIQLRMTLMSKSERRKFKRKKKMVEKGESKNKKDYLDVYGENATADLKLKLEEYWKRRKIDSLREWEIQHLILWIMAKITSPRWIFVKNGPLVSNVVVISIDCFTMNFYQSHHKSLPVLNQIFKTMPLNEEKKSEANKSIPFEIKNSLYDSSSALAALLRCNQKLLKSSMAQLYPNEQHNKKKEPSMVAKKRRKLEGSKDVSQSAGHDSSSGDSKEEVEFYLCTKQELLVNKFPLPDDKELEGYITLPEKRNDEGISPRLFGIDCEMVRTEGDEAPAPGEKGRLDLARVSVVNEDHKTVYDKFVKPARRILDYCTKWSGITPELLEGEGVLTLKEVQRDLCDMLTSHDVLVGHSLENDLHALRIVHTKVLDTSILYPHPRGPPRKQSLKFISEKFLGRQIQKETEEGQKEMGHDSTEDAIAALELAQLKIKNGPTFGIQSPNTTGLFQILLCHRRSCAMFGSHKSVKQFAKPDSVNAIACSNDSETFRKLSSYCAKFDVCIANCSSILKNATEAKIKELDNGIRRVYQKCPRNTLLIVLSGQGPSEELLRLNKERAQKRNRWTLKEENELKWKEVSARKGVAFFTVKTEAAS